VETFSRSSKRLDHECGTQELAESIVRIGIAPCNFVIASDHHGLFIDFNSDAFLGGDPSHLMSPALRGVKRNSPKQCRKQVKAPVTQHLTQPKVFEQGTRTHRHLLTRMACNHHSPDDGNELTETF
jgi:hypothetical protein